MVNGDFFCNEWRAYLSIDFVLVLLFQVADKVYNILHHHCGRVQAGLLLHLRTIWVISA